MNLLQAVLQTIEAQRATEPINIDVFIKTNEEDGDGYAYIFTREDGRLDVNYLQNRIPTNAWKTEEGVEEAYEINQDGKQYYVIVHTLEDAIGAIADFWMTSREDLKVIHHEVKGDGLIQLVLELKK